MNLIKTINDAHIKLIMESELTDIEEKVQEWRGIKKQQAVFVAITKMMASRISELEADLLPYVKDIAEQQTVIDTAVVAYKTRNATSVKYQAAFAKALEISNKKQREVLQEFLTTVTTKDTKESVAIADPDLEEFLAKLSDVSIDELADKIGDVSKLPRNIVNKKKREGEIQEGVAEVAAGALKKLVSVLKSAFLKLKSKITASGTAANKLLVAAEAE